MRDAVSSGKELVINGYRYRVGKKYGEGISLVSHQYPPPQDFPKGQREPASDSFIVNFGFCTAYC